MSWFRFLLNRVPSTECDPAMAAGIPMYLLFEKKDPFVYVFNDDVFLAWCGERTAANEYRGLLRALAAGSQLLVYLRLVEKKFGNEIARIIREHLLILADRVPDLQIPQLIRVMEESVERNTDQNGWSWDATFTERVATSALGLVTVPPWRQPEGANNITEPSAPREIVEALSELLKRAIEDAMRVFGPVVVAITLKPQSVRGLRKPEEIG